MREIQEYYCVTYTTCDHSEGERFFTNKQELDAKGFSQSVEEDGGSASMNDMLGNDIDIWDVCYTKSNN